MARGPHRKHLGSKGRETHWRRVLRMNLRNRRIQLGLKQRELGEAVGTNQQYIQQIESRNSPDVVPSLFLLADLAKVLKTTMYELLLKDRFGTEISGDVDLRQFRSRVIHDRGPMNPDEKV